MKAYMCLTCKIGGYNKVLEELMKMGITRGNIFLLFGPFDILVKFDELKDLEDFIEKWFIPITMIGGGDALIIRSMTFIVIQEGPSYLEEPFAFLFLNTKPRDLSKVQTALLKVPGVLSADTVFGPYDLICAVKVKDREDLERIIAYIQKNILGIEQMMTTITAMIRI